MSRTAITQKFKMSLLFEKIEQSVIQRMRQNDGIYLPPDIVLGRHVFFAVDNVDFSDDTHDGRNTFRGAPMASYQKTKSDDAKLEVRLILNNTQLVCVKPYIKGVHYSYS